MINVKDVKAGDKFEVVNDCFKFVSGTKVKVDGADSFIGKSGKTVLVSRPGMNGAIYVNADNLDYAIGSRSPISKA